MIYNEGINWDKHETSRVPTIYKQIKYREPHDAVFSSITGYFWYLVNKLMKLWPKCDCCILDMKRVLRANKGKSEVELSSCLKEE